MIRKFVFCAVLCVASAQLQEEVSKDPVQNGLKQAEALYNVGKENLQNNITQVYNYVGYIEEYTRNSLKKADSKMTVAKAQQARIENARANAFNSPPCPFECIERIHEKGILLMKIFKESHQHDIVLHIEDKLPKVRVAGEPLYEFQVNLEYKHRAVVGSIENCTDQGCANEALRSYRKWIQDFHVAIANVHEKVLERVADINRNAMIYDYTVFKDMEESRAKNIVRMMMCVFDCDM